MMSKRTIPEWQWVTVTTFFSVEAQTHIWFIDAARARHSRDNRKAKLTIEKLLSFSFLVKVDLDILDLIGVSGLKENTQISGLVMLAMLTSCLRR